MKDKLKWPAVLLLLLCILPGILLGAGAAMPSCYSESYSPPCTADSGRRKGKGWLWWAAAMWRSAWILR